MNRELLILISLAIISITSAVAQNFPSTEWDKVKSPTFYGWNDDQLETIEEYLIDSTATTGMMIVQDGRVIYEYGNTTENSYIASCRKSILAMLYGQYVENKTIDLNTTLDDMQFTNDGLLSEQELTTSVKDIISSRSGIYLPAANGGDMTDLAPKRGTVKPGELWIYNNWDFNVAGYIFENLTQKNIYDEIGSQFVVPMEFQDWDRNIQEKDGDGLTTDVLAYHIHFSARDMARLGLLMLNNGNWNGQQIIPESWVKEMVHPHTPFEEVDKIAPFIKNEYNKKAYGYMWWLMHESKHSALENAYSAQGAWGQNITVMPNINTVVVIKTNDLYLRQYGDHDFILDQVARAYDPNQKVALEKLANSLSNDDIGKFVAEFTNSTPKSENINYQDLINSLAYHYLNDKKDLEKAMSLFQLNVDQFPSSWMVYDGLAEAYFHAGKFEKSLQYYEKTIKLNTDNMWDNNTRVSYIINRIKQK